MHRSAVIVALISMAYLAESHVCFIGEQQDPSQGRIRRALSTPDPCGCTSIDLGGLNVGQAPRTYQPVYMDELILSPADLQSHFECPQVVWALEDTVISTANDLTGRLERLEQWISDNIQQIRVSLLKEGSRVVELVFDVSGVGATEKWFRPENLIRSPQWPSLTPSRTVDYSYFGINAEPAFGWYYCISPMPEESDCYSQTGWMVVHSISTYGHSCPWMNVGDESLTLLYSLTNEPVQWMNALTSIPVSLEDNTLEIVGFPPDNAVDGSCSTCYKSVWGEGALMSIQLDSDWKVKMVELRICQEPLRCNSVLEGALEYAGNCYHILNEKVSHSEAEAYCKSLNPEGDENAGWTVVDIEDANENAFVSGALADKASDLGVSSPSTGIWLGLKKINGQWSNSRRPASSYDNWAQYEPSDGPNCAAMLHGDGGLWRARWCDQADSRQLVMCKLRRNTLSNVYVLVGPGSVLSEATLCHGRTPSSGSLHHLFKCPTELEGTHVFIKKSDSYLDQLTICDVKVYFVDDAAIGIADSLTLEYFAG